MNWVLCRAIAILVGFAGEQLVGWPRKLYHPIMAIGALISKAEKGLRAVFPKSQAGERTAGILMALTLPLISFGLTGGALYFLYRWSWIAGFLAESAMCWSIFASGSLRDAAGEVGIALSESLDAGRKAVAMIVGRDTERLTEEGVIKATVETVAENLSDGVIAPLVFTALGGAAGGYFYKTVNTMDSMVGYRNDRYRYFGTGAARLDDVCNFLPARLTALLMILLSGVHLLQKVVDDIQLVRNLCTAQNGHKGTLRIGQGFAHNAHFLLHQIAADGREIICHTGGGGVGTVRRAEGVVYKQIC